MITHVGWLNELKENDTVSALQTLNLWIKELREQRSYVRLKAFLNEMETEEEVLHLLNLCSDGGLYQYESILIRFANLKFKSPRSTLWHYQLQTDLGFTVKTEQEALHYLDTVTLDPALQRKFYLLLASIYQEMKRFKTASQYIERAEQIDSLKMEEVWGCFYQAKGEMTKAEEWYLCSLKSHPTEFRGYLGLSRLKAELGDIEAALSIINEGLSNVQNHPRLLIEKVRYSHLLQYRESFFQTYNLVQDITPYNSYMKTIDYMRAQWHYHYEEKEELKQLLKKYPDSKSITRLAKSNSGQNSKRLQLSPVVQKFNYCVPACVEMILASYGEKVSQDEVASHIFDVDGSSLGRTIDYLENRGMNCKYFNGSVDLYKRMIDQNIAILLSVIYPKNAHVQLVKGYDDNIQSLIIQDPGTLDEQLIPYETFIKRYYANEFLSIAITPNQHDILNRLPDDFHNFLREVDGITGSLVKGNNHLLKKLSPLFRDQKENATARCFAIMHPGLVQDHSLLREWIADALEAYPESDFYRIACAETYVALDEYEEADKLLTELPKIHYRHDFWFRKGHIDLIKHEYELALKYFEKSLNYEPDQYDTWSYIAVCHQELGNYEEAIRCAEISLEINDKVAFSKLNHATILKKQNQLENIEKRFKEISRTNRFYIPGWLERAELYKEQYRYRKAVRCLKIALSMDPEIEWAYKELASLYDILYDDFEKGTFWYREGLLLYPDSGSILFNLTEHCLQHRKLDEARNALDRFKKVATDDPYSLLLEIRWSIANEEKQKAKEALFELTEYQTNDCYFWLNAGELLNQVISGNEETYDASFQVALSFIEKGIETYKGPMEEPLQMYVSLIGQTPHYKRGIEFLSKLTIERPDDVDLICYTGSLYEENGQFTEAMSWYEHAASMQTRSTFPHFRLGEMHKNQGDYERATLEYEQCIEFNPEFATAYLHLSQIAKELENEKEEKRYLNKVLILDPMMVDIDHAINLYGTQGLFELLRLLEDSKGRTPDDWRYTSLAKVHGAMGEETKEEEYLQKALQYHPDYLPAHIQQAIHYNRKGDWKAAKKLLIELLPDHHESRQLYRTLTELLRERKRLLYIPDTVDKMDLDPKVKSKMFSYFAVEMEQDYFEAIEKQNAPAKRRFAIFSRLKDRMTNVIHAGLSITLYEEAIKLDEKNLEAVYWFSEFYEKAEILDEAIDVLVTALEHTWDYDFAHRIGILSLDRSVELEDEHERMEVLQQGESYLMACLEDNPEAQDVYALLGYTYLEGSQLDKAKEMFDQSLLLDPTHAASYFGAGIVSNECEQYDMAIDYLKMCVEHEPNHRDGLNQLSIAFSRTGMLSEAIQAVNRMIELDDEDLLAYYNRACYRSQLGEVNQAIQDLQFVIETEEDGFFKDLATTDEDLDRLRESESTRKHFNKLVFDK